MKVVTMILLTLFLGKGCSQKDIADTQIQYTANTRGFYQKITIKNQEVAISNDRGEEGNGAASKISDADWKELIALFSKINLDSLSTYEGPTQKRLYDGAAIANMTVNYKGKDYETNSFDHGNPPVEIADFVNKVVSFGKK